MNDRVVYFDGVCNLCNAAVDFLIRHDKAGSLKYASLQGETAARQLPSEQRQSLATVIFVDRGHVYTESSAALHATAALGGLWSGARLFLLVPPFVRNAVYRFVAKNRYAWFGRRDTCRLPTMEERARFLP